MITEASKLEHRNLQYVFIFCFVWSYIKQIQVYTAKSLVSGAYVPTLSEYWNTRVNQNDMALWSFLICYSQNWHWSGSVQAPSGPDLTTERIDVVVASIHVPGVATQLWIPTVSSTEKAPAVKGVLHWVWRQVSSVTIYVNPYPTKRDCRSFWLRAIPLRIATLGRFGGFPRLAYKYTLKISCNTKQWLYVLFILTNGYNLLKYVLKIFGGCTWIMQ